MVLSPIFLVSLLPLPFITQVNFILLIFNNYYAYFFCANATPPMISIANSMVCIDIISPRRIYENPTEKTGIKYTNTTNRDISSLAIASYQKKIAIKLGNNASRNIIIHVSIERYCIVSIGSIIIDIIVNPKNPNSELNPNISNGFIFFSPLLVIMLDIA